MRKIILISFLLLPASLRMQAQGEVVADIMADSLAVDSLAAEPEVPQDRLDTIYYNRNWKVTGNRSFADYYRLALYPADESLPHEFRTFYITGEREGEGSFIDLDKTDDRLSTFDGEVLRYFKSGTLAERAIYEKGVLTDTRTTYYENGNIREHATMSQGKRDGLVKRFTEDGRVCRFIPFKGGVEEGYYVTVDVDGNYSKYNLTTEQPMLEPVTQQDMQTEYKNGVAWPYYNKNGLIVGVSNSDVSDLGGMREIGFYVLNKSMINVDLDPAKVEIYAIMKNDKRQDMEVMPADEYDEKVLKGKKKVEKAKIKQKVVLISDRENNVSNNLGMTGVNAGQLGNIKVFQERMVATQNLQNVSNELSFGHRGTEDLGYLERTTIHPGECVSAFLYTKQKKVPVLRVKLTLGGIDYLYEWISEKN